VVNFIFSELFFFAQENDDKAQRSQPHFDTGLLFFS